MAGGHLGSPAGGQDPSFTSCFYTLPHRMTGTCDGFQNEATWFDGRSWGWEGGMLSFNCPHGCSENSPFYSKLNSVNVPNIND